jgi:pimeloyl-ACP methyl ester carboxylesterase
VATEVVLTGSGFTGDLRVFVGGVEAAGVEVLSATEARAMFGPVELTDVGPKDVRAEQGELTRTLPEGFTFYFDEDPIVFVHGYFVNVSEWDVMINRFRELGYPDDYLWAIAFSSTIQSSRINARDELPPFVDEVLAATGAAKVDIVAHSMGGLSTRLWIKSYGGADLVRDYVSLSGTHHGTAMSCLIPWLGQGSAETCPAYADEDESVNGVQWELNGDPDTPDVDETPFGVEDGGGIYWYALRTDADHIDVPSHTCCLNQSFRGDCSDPVNTTVHGVGHIAMAFDPEVFALVVERVRSHNPSQP